MNLFNFAGIIGDAIADTWMSIWLSLNNMVYNIIEALYKVFVSVANVNLFSEDAFNKITSRIYVVMGIAMLFIFAYNLILMIINPEDKKGTGQMTKVVKETIISLVLVVLLPTIFNYMSVLQRHILDSNILGQIILVDTGGTSADKCDEIKEYTILNDQTDIGDRKLNYEWYDWILNAVPVVGIPNTIAHVINYFIQTPTLPTDYLYNSCVYYSTLSPAVRGASSIASTLFSAFYHPSEYGFYECQEYITKCKGDSACETDKIKEDADKKMCSYYYYDVKLASYTGSLKPFNEESYFYSKVKNNEDTFVFDYLLAFVAGCFAVYMFVCYTMAIGVRVAKLGFLQIISPIAVMMRIIPKQKEAMFDKWFKNLKDTYLDVFIRLAIIYFALFAISLVPDVINSLFTSFEGNFLVRALSMVVVILGILKFAGDAPALFKEFFGGMGSGNFSLKSPKKQLEENKLAMRGVNAVKGGVYGATTGKGWGKLSGALSGAGRGAVGGYDKAVNGLDTARTERDNGSRWYNRAIDRTRVGIGMETRAEGEDRITNRLNEKIKVNNEDEKKLKEIKNKTTDAITKDTSKVTFDGFNFDGVDFSGMKYVQVKEYEDVLKSSYESATDEASKRAAYQKLIDFQNEFSRAMKAKVDAGVTSLINGTDFYGAFDDADYAVAKSNIADVLSNEHRDKVTNEIITSIGDADELKSTLESIGADNRNKSNQISGVTTKHGYQARHADSRMVRGNGQSEKK